MDEKKKGIIFGTLALVAGIAMIAYGVINLMKDKEPVEDNTPSDVDGPSITVTEDDIKTWSSDNKTLLDYFILYNDKTEFDLDTATEEDISNVFAWYFVHVYDHGDDEKPTDSKYRYRYTMPKSDAEVFMQNYLGVPLDMLNLETITINKDYFVFSSDDENFYVDIVDLGFDDGGLTYSLDTVEILSDSEIDVSYQVKNDILCKTEGEECKTTTKLLTLRKADEGFTILRATTVGDTETDNNNLEDNTQEDNQTENDNTNQETENNEISSENNTDTEANSEE